MADMITTERIVGLKEELSPGLKYINANKAPFYLNLIALGKVRTIGSTTASWVDYSCEGTETVITAALTDTTGTSVTVADSTVFPVNSYLRVDEEVMLVQSIADKVLTVKRGELGTTAATHTINTAAYFINDNIEEGADLLGASYKPGENFTNYTQIVREEISISGTAQALAVPSGGGLDPYSLEMIRKMDKVVGKVEKAMVAGKKFATGKNRGMDGIRTILDKGQIVDGIGEKITMEKLEALLKKAYLVGADLQNGYYAFYIPPKQQSNLNKEIEKYIVKEETSSTLGAVVKEVYTSYGIIPLIMTPNLPDNEILLVNHENCEIRPVINRDLFHEYMGKTGDNIKGLIVGEFTLEVRGVHEQGKIVNLGV